MEKTRRTFEEIGQEAASVRAKIEANITAWNEAQLENDYKKMAELDLALKELEKQYAELSQSYTFTKLNGNMLEAIKHHSFVKLRHKDTVDGDSNTKTRELVESDAQFDLYDFDRFYNGKASADAKWVGMAERFSMLCCIHVANQLKVENLKDIGKQYFISKTAKDIKLAEENKNVANPISATQMLKALQAICNAIIFEEKFDEEGKSLGNAYKVKSQDVAWLLFTYGRKDSKGKITLKVAQGKNFRKILGDVLYRVVTDGDYKIAYREMLKK